MGVLFYRKINSEPPPIFSCEEYVPLLTNLYVGNIEVSTQDDINTLIGYDGIDGNITFYDNSSLIDISPLENIKEITGELRFLSDNLPNLTPMTGLRYVGGNFFIDINSGTVSLNGFCYNLTNINGYLHFYGGSSLQELGPNLMRRLTTVGGDLLIKLNPGAEVSLNGVFPCLETVVGEIEISTGQEPS
jgi:hypothetical protein